MTEGKLFIPKPTVIQEAAAPAEAPSPEELVFDKAEEAESIETLQQTHDEVQKEIEALEKGLKEAESDAEKEGLNRQLTRLTTRRERLAKLLEAKQTAAEDSE